MALLLVLSRKMSMSEDKKRSNQQNPMSSKNNLRHGQTAKLSGHIFRTKRMLCLCLVATIALLAAQVYFVFVSPPAWINPPSRIGICDFQAYWAAFHVTLGGGNPYDSEQVLALQKQVLTYPTEAQVFLNPPWTLAILSPVLALPFAVARWLWLFLNVLFAVGAVLLWRKYTDTARPAVSWHIIGAFFFMPVLTNLWVGQLSLLILVSTLYAMLCLKNQRNILAGLALLPLTMKPHYLLVFLVIMAYWLLREKRWQTLLSASLGMIAILVLTYCLQANLFSMWLNMNFSPLVWKTPTLATLLRHLQFNYTGVVPSWPTIALPLIGVVSTLLWLFRKPRNINWPELLPPALGLSLIVSPYAWPHDFSLLLPIHLWALSLASWPTRSFDERRFILLGTWAIQLAVLVVGFIVINLEVMVWFPYVMLGWWWTLTRRFVAHDRNEA